MEASNRRGGTHAALAPRDFRRQCGALCVRLSRTRVPSTLPVPSRMRPPLETPDYRFQPLTPRSQSQAGSARTIADSYEIKMPPTGQEDP